MHILHVGLNYETATVDLRERLAFSQESLPTAYEQLSKLNLAETVIISTCNRVELYSVIDNVDDGLPNVLTFLSRFHSLPMDAFKAHLNILTDVDAVRHLFSVASSIKSMVLGETQIQGQIKQAYETARKCGVKSTVLANLFQSALKVGKRVRNQTSISEHSLSISHAAIKLLQSEFQDLSQRNIVVIGNGKMSSMAVKTLVKKGVGRLTIVNRTEENARQLADELDLCVAGFDGLEQSLRDADIVISSTGAPHTILSQKMIADVMAERAARPLTIIDIAVPRDVEPEVEKVGGVALYDIDTFQANIEANREKRTKEVNKVLAIVEEEVDIFVAWVQTLKVKPVITDLKQLAEEIRSVELARAFRKFDGELSDSDSQIIQDLTRRIVNKVLHQPITCLREEAGEGNGRDYTDALKHLFGLQETSSVNSVEYS